MNRAFAAALALTTGLAAVGAASAQSYGQPNSGQSGYGQPGYAQPGYGQPQQREDDRGRGDDRYGRDRDGDQDQRGPDSRYQQQPSGYADDRGYDPRPNTTPTYPDRQNGDRRYQGDRRSVDPAPGARGPYVGAGPRRFYNVEDRIGRVEARLAGLSASQRRRAYIEMRSIRAEERTQRAKHGGQLRDWDREHLNQRLDALVARYPGLGR